jgi:hypothetical protein
MDGFFHYPPTAASPEPVPEGLAESGARVRPSGMRSDLVLRRAMAAAAAFNVLGALLVAFPESAPGKLAGLPAGAPVPYRALAAFFILLFGGAYAWLATRRSPDRPLVAFSAIGKACAFLLFLGLWVASQLPLGSVLTASGDLVLAAIFAWWLLGSHPSAPAAVSRQGA